MSEHTPHPTHIVADADVLVADLFVAGSARETLDTIRSHSWFELIATEELLDDAEAVIRTVSDPELAGGWRTAVADIVTIVEQPAGDHPALAAAYHGDATHIISLDEQLNSVAAGANLKARLEVSIRSPDAFVAIVDPAAIYELAFDEPYPGPDRDPRA